MPLSRRGRLAGSVPQSPDGAVNLAPFSHFNIVSTAPPVILFSCNTPADRAEKDTLANVRATGEFVFNLATYDLREAVNRTSSPVPYEVDEFDLAGLEKAPSINVRPPPGRRIARQPRMHAAAHRDNRAGAAGGYAEPCGVRSRCRAAHA